MKIRYLGHSSFLLVSSGGVHVVTDPYGDIGLKFPSVKADGVTVSHSHFDHCNIDAVDGNFEVFDRAGNFTLGDVKISAIRRYHDSVMGLRRGKTLLFFFEIDGVKLCHMGDLGEKCSKELVSLISFVDILMIPVGGNYTIDAQEAKKFAEAIHPKVILPMHYFVEGLKVDVESPERFLSKFSSYETAEGELEFQAENLPSRSKVIYLKRSF